MTDDKLGSMRGSISVRKCFSSLSILCLFVQASLGCAWDRDTIGDEVALFPEVSDAIMGRLKVMPKSFYEARIQILLKKNSKYSLAELDDLTVAYDKLGDFPNALRYSKQKSELLKSEKNADQEYRYWANLGTIEAHQALRNRESVNTDLLQSSIGHLEKAVDLNPNAHFGRESVQIEALKLIEDQLGAGKLELEPKLKQQWDDFVKTTGADKVRKGIVGMMAFGSGPDNYELLTLLQSTIKDNEGNLQQMIEKRLTEVIGARRPFFEFQNSANEPMYTEQFQADYVVLKKDAQDYRELVEAYVDTKLNQGKHPDTDPKFWMDWKEKPRPNLKMIAILHPNNRATYVIGAFLLAIVILPWIAMALIMKKLRSNRSEP